MDYLLVVFLAFAISGQSVIGGFYKKRPGSPFVYQMAIATAAFVFFFIGSKFQIEFNKELLLFGGIYGLSYSACFIGQILAIKEGSVSLTALILSYSLVIPTLFGVIVYNELPSTPFYIGFVLLVVSLLFVGIPREKNTLKITKKWVIYVVIAFISNGICAIVMSRYQMITNGGDSFGFMSCAMLCAVIISLVALLISKENKKEKAIRTALYGGVCGTINAASNLSLMILCLGAIPLSVVYPTISAGSLVISAVLSRILFKEKLDKLGIIGVLIGVISVALMNI